MINIAEKTFFAIILIALLISGVLGYVWYHQTKRLEERSRAIELRSEKLQEDNIRMKRDFYIREIELDSLVKENSKLDKRLLITNNGIVKLKQQHNENRKSIRNLSTDSTIVLLAINLSPKGGNK